VGDEESIEGSRSCCGVSGPAVRGRPPRIGGLEGHASISTDVLARYAADAATEVAGVRELAESHVPGRRGVRVLRESGRLSLELRLRLERGASVPAVGSEVQRRVRDYLRRMADVEPEAVNVIVDEIGPAGP
jgi:uncharacterized alkaline shock family protein YloU